MATETLPETREVHVERRSDGGEVLATVALDRSVFGVTPNVPLMHQVVTAQLAAKRSGTHSTKTRAEVAGGASKPYRQKGTGRARQGTIRAPQFAGGGVALGPKPRSYAQRTPRKMIRQALHCALSDRVAEGRLCLVDRWSFEVPKTKDAIRALDALGLEGSVLVVLGPEDAVAERSFANLQQVDLVEGGQLTAYDVLANDWIVFTDDSILGEVTVVKQAPAKKAAAKKAPAKKAAAKKAAPSPADDEAAEDDEPVATTEEAPAKETAEDAPTEEAPVAEAEAEVEVAEASGAGDETPAEEPGAGDDETEKEGE